ncbi:MAG TPA: hypothetical protein VHD15_04370 [Hyphomicrobiales bacterium]|nr:hypothetical protein [Hyphomicrobiales bacterium]
MDSRFVIFAHPRTGSYNLVSLLNSADDIACYGELFKPHWVELDEKIKKAVGVETVEQRDADHLGFLERLRAATPQALFGFKLFNYHLRRIPGVLEDLKSPRWKIVALVRDPIETYASTLRAQSTNIWTLKDGHPPPEERLLNAKVSFSRDTLEAFATYYNRFLDRIAAWRELKGADVFTLYYNQVGHEPHMASLLDFLGSSASPASLQSEYRRQFGSELEKGFDNWESLLAYRETNWPFHALPPASTM